MSLVRDEVIGALLQTPLDKNSGGDSAMSSGMMALFGSKQDQDAILKFEKPFGSGLLCRHPLWYDDSDFTRDQLLVIMAGFWASNTKAHTAIARRVFWRHARRLFFCQNYKTQFDHVDKGFFGRDPLSPSHIGHLIRCARIWWLYWFLPISNLWLSFDIIWATKVHPRSEQNQIIAMMEVKGDILSWVFKHPNWKQAIKNYYCDNEGKWRDKREMAMFIITKINTKIFSEILSKSNINIKYCKK